LINLDSLIKNLDEKKGTEIHQFIANALEVLGFEVKCIEKTEVKPDIIAKSLNPKFALIIESCIVENKSVPAKKTGQLRQSGARYKKELNDEGFKNSYYVIIGKPYFAQNIEKASDPDICLLTITELIDLVKTHQKYLFTLEDLEGIFLNPGKAVYQMKYVFSKYKKPVLIFGFLIEGINEKLKSVKKIKIDELKIAVKTLFDLLLPNFLIKETEIEESIIILTSNILNIYSIEIEGKNHFIVKNDHNVEKHLPLILGNLGTRIIEAYYYCKELKMKIITQEKKEF